MFWWLLLLLFIVYLGLIGRLLFRIKGLSKLLDKIKTLLNELNSKNIDIEYLPGDIIVKIVALKPQINEYLGYYRFADLSYNKSKKENLMEIVKIQNYLFERHDELVHELFKTLNPISSIKFILNTPAYLFSLLNINLRYTSRIIVNSISWALVAVYKLFTPEIKLLLISWFT
ncbi:hypothetical protein [Listeria booriae]|uniref:hypothetical protein n=1 Tax=Listeria booriae TaxID=1552123 RepID=UPI00163DBA1F|nr:hypothetical protein [Listeria booriae]MBC1306822.1 hypothetical protein [Listeria booriae]